jgi:hypothetical protein
MHLTRAQRTAHQRRLNEQGPPAAAETLLAYTQRLGLPLVMLGVGSIVPLHFWWSISVIYVGAFIGLFALRKEKLYQEANKKSKRFYRSAYALAVCIFTAWLFWPNSITVTASSLVPTYGPGSTISGMRWRPEFAQVSFTVENPSGADLDNFDMIVSTDLKLEDVTAASGLAACRVNPVMARVAPTQQREIGGQPIGPVIENSADYAVIPFGKDGLPLGTADGTNRQFRIRCDKFPAHDHDTFVAFVSVVNPWVNGKPPQKPYGTPRNPAWFSSKADFVVAGRPKSARITECKIGVECSG